MYPLTRHNIEPSLPGGCTIMLNWQVAFWLCMLVAMYVIRWRPAPNLVPGTFDLNICLSGTFELKTGSRQKIERCCSCCCNCTSIACGQKFTNGPTDAIDDFTVMTVVHVAEMPFELGLYALNLIVCTPAPRWACSCLAHCGFASTCVLQSTFVFGCSNWT